MAYGKLATVTGIINGGFFVLSREAFKYIDDNRDCILERQPLKRLVDDRQLAVYQHKGYWFAADTIKDLEVIEQELKSNRPFWYGKSKYLMSLGKE